MPNEIPLYTADGALEQWITMHRMERMSRLGLIRVVRHKKGYVNRCIRFLRPGDSKPLKPADYLGARYSFREYLGSGHVAWSLKRLGRGNELRPLFQQVVADCMADAPATAARTARVVTAGSSGAKQQMRIRAAHAGKREGER